MFLEYAFFRYALIGILIISVASALIGTYVVTRRLVAIAGGVTHACFGGLGLGYFLDLNPLAVAGAFAVGAALGVDVLERRGHIRSDSAIAVVWAIGMAIGVIFVFLTPGYVPELNTFLFGNILTITRADLWVFGIYTVALAVFCVAARRLIVATSFDADFARVRRLPVAVVSTVMTVFVAVGIVLTIRLVGVMLLMSMITLPQMVAENYTRRITSMALLSVGVSMACCLGGLWLSTVVDVPCSALIVAVLAAAFVLARLSRPLLRRRRETLTAVAFALCALGASAADEGAWFVPVDIPADVAQRMRGRSLPDGAAVALSDLRYIALLHYDLEGSERSGEIVVNAAIADDVASIFRQLHALRYPLESVRLIDDFDADDEQSMRANNSSGFCYRTIGGSRRLSRHALGMAVDINPLYNPFFIFDSSRSEGYRTLQPATAAPYVDRRADFPCKLTADDPAVRLFKEHGFTWGGDWASRKDYQHFERAE